MSELNLFPKNKKNLINIAFIFVLSIVLFCILISGESPQKLLSVIENTHKKYLLLAGGCIIIYWIFDGISLYIISNKLVPSFHFRQALQTSMLGQLFNCITPFASGGQPVQAYSMVKYKIPLGTSSSILLAKFIIFQTVLTLYSFVVLFFKFQYFSDKISNFRYLVFLGFAVNTGVVLFLIAIGFFPHVTKRILIRLTKLLSKIKLVKNELEIIQKLEVEIIRFHDCFCFIRTNKSIIFISLIIVVFQLTFYYLIPYFICLSLKVPDIDPINIISAGAFVLMISSFIPLPGASGGAEGSFYLFFGYFFLKTGNIGIAILIWRIFTFYITILVGTIFSRPVK